MLPTLPVRWPARDRSIAAVVMPDKQRRDRLAFAIRYAMDSLDLTAQGVADRMEPKRSKETVARWARGETVPSALDIEPLATALEVEATYLIKPEPIPEYPLAKYRRARTELEQAVASGAEEGLRRARTPAKTGAVPRPQSPQRPARAG